MKKVLVVTLLLLAVAMVLQSRPVAAYGTGMPPVVGPGPRIDERIEQIEQRFQQRMAQLEERLNTILAHLEARRATLLERLAERQERREEILERRAERRFR